MKEPFERLRHIREQRGYETSTAAAAAFGWNQTTYIQHENGRREISRMMAPRYARAFRVTAGWIMFDEPMVNGKKSAVVRFAGMIGAGQEVRPIDDQSETIEASFWEAGAEAFEVAGDSMLPLARNRDIIICSAPKPLRDVIGCECVVELEDGRRFFKTVERGSSSKLHTLISHNAEPIRDVAVTAAGSLIAVKRR